MKTVLPGILRSALTFSWLTGPIFDKELCVSSRRRRNYLLRSSYILILMAFLSLFWAAEMRFGGGSAVYQASRMARIGKSVILFVVWFQFLTTQLVAVIMLSNSISDEIYHKTLATLATTPITGLQIVVGKLLSKLLQLGLLLAISLPLLAAIRVFGGVPWGYVISALAITVSTLVFIASLTLFFSIFTRRAYVTMIITVLTLGVVFALFPLMTVLVSENMDLVPDRTLFEAFTLLHPYVLLTQATNMMMFARPGRVPMYLYVAGNCGIMLVAAALLTVISTVVVRRIALRQACGQLGKSTAAEPVITVNRKTTIRHESSMRRVWRAAITWKELRSPLLGRNKLLSMLIILGTVFLVLITYLLCGGARILDDMEVQMVYCVAFAGIGTLVTLVLPAAAISSEKESRALPLLLATTMGDWQITLGKFLGSLLRILPAWILLAAHVFLFVLAGITHPLILLQLPPIVASAIFFLCCTGLYFSSRFRRTTVAVVANFVLAAVIWLLIPLLLFMALGISRASEDLAEMYVDTTLPFQFVVIVDACNRGVGSSYDGLRYYWATGSSRDAFGATLLTMICAGLYYMIGLFFLWRSKVQLRRNVF